MTTYNELTNVHDVRVEFLDPLQLTTAVDDHLILSFIKSLSAALTTNANRRYVPVIDTYSFDVPPWWSLNPRSGIPRLYVNDDLLEVLTLTNGDGAVIAASDYNLYPLNESVKHEIALKPSSGLLWQSASGNVEGAVTLRGVWGYHEDYASAWLDTGATLGAGINTSATSVTATTGLIRAGYLVKVDSEYLYVSAVTAGSSDTLTLVRGVNGSSPASHSSGASLTRWYQPALDSLMRVAVAAQVRLRDNPIGDVVRIGEASFSTPKDVLKYIDTHMDLMGLSKVGIG